MTAALFATLWAPARAATVDEGLQAQIYPSGFDFVSDQLASQAFAFGPTDLSGSWDCYDELSITDFNLSLALDSVTIEPKSGSLSIDVQLGEVRGEDMGLHGVSGWFDLCIDFDTTLKYVSLNDGRLQGELSAEVVDGALELAFVDPPVVTGDFDSDINWFPDDLAWAFVESTVLDLVADVLSDQLPPLVADATADGLLDAEFGGVPVTAFVGDVAASKDGLYAAVDVDLGGDGAKRHADLDLAQRGDAHFAVGLTEEMAAEVLAATWSTGLLSPDSETTAALVGSLLADLGLGDDLEVALGLGGPPSVTVDPEGIRLSLPATTLTATSGGEVALSLTADVTGWLEVDVANGGIALTAHELALDVLEMDASHLVDEDPEHLQAFLEGWVAQAATTALGTLEVYQANFDALGYVLRLDETESQDGGIVAWFTLFAADDPEVDRAAPDTAITATLSGATATASFSATDDRPGALLYSWRVDDGSWSRWSAEASAVVDVEPGDHTIEVIARDAWYNVDPTAAVAAVSVSEVPADADDGKGCGCGGVGGGSLGGVALALVALRRRQRIFSR